MHGKFLFGRLVRANYYSKKRGIEYVLQNTISLVFRLEMVERSGLNTNAGAWETNVACVEAMLVGTYPQTTQKQRPNRKMSAFCFVYLPGFSQKMLLSTYPASWLDVN